MAESFYVNRGDLDRMDRLYNPKDKEYQGTCVAYMYGITYAEAVGWLDSMDEADIAKSCEYAALRDYPDYPVGARHEKYEQRLEERSRVEKQYDLSPMDAFIKRDELLDAATSASRNGKRDTYYFVLDNDRAAACEEYARLQQNILSSSSQERMEVLDRMAAESGLKFSMTNGAAYNQPNALVKPVFEMTAIEKNLGAENSADAAGQDFADAVASISVTDNRMEQ